MQVLLLCCATKLESDSVLIGSAVSQLHMCEVNGSMPPYHTTFGYISFGLLGWAEAGCCERVWSMAHISLTFVKLKNLARK